jgi:hypothetical protein
MGHAKRLEKEELPNIQTTVTGIYVQLVSFFQATTRNTCSVSMAYSFDSTAYYKETTKSCHKSQMNDRYTHKYD